MTPLRLTTWFRTRMAPLVAVTMVVVATAAPVAFFLRERSGLRRLGTQGAQRAARALQDEIAVRPRLWRYASAKLGEQLVVAGLSGTHIRLFDLNGEEVRLEGVQAELPEHAMWSHMPVSMEGKQEATVWVAVDAQPLWTGTGQLSVAFGLLALSLGMVLYRVPVSTIARAEYRINRLMGRLAMTMQEEDRQRMAHDLHDGVGQAITAARLELLVLRGHGAAAQQVDRIAARLDESLDEVRRATEALAPAPLIELGLARAIERHCESFADAASISVICAIDPDRPALPVELQAACYRIVQEALTNVARHAEAQHAWVTLQLHDTSQLTLQISDDGQGVELADEKNWTAGQGLAGVRKRVTLLGGTMSIETKRGAGLRLIVTLPVPRDNEDVS